MKKKKNRKFTLNDVILLLPIIGRMIFEFQVESERKLWKRLFIFFQNTLLYYLIGIIGTVFYPDIILHIGIGVFSIFSILEYYFIKKKPELFGAGDIPNFKWYHIFFTFYNEFWYFLAGYVSSMVFF